MTNNQRASMSAKVAVVTGSNKGIGYQIVRKLCQLLPEGSTVILTSRNQKKGEQAVESLKREGHYPVLHQLELTDSTSIQKLRDYIYSTYGGLDILVNNAGFAFKMAATEPYSKMARETLRINFFGTLNLSRALLPLMRPNGRVVNVASRAGMLGQVARKLQKELMREELTEQELETLMNRFITDVEMGVHEQNGWPENSAYGVSKLGVNILTRIQARTSSEYAPHSPGVLVNSCCPGWCKSDMAGWERPPLTAEQGADTPVFLALLPEGSKLNGQFVAEREPISLQ